MGKAFSREEDERLLYALRLLDGTGMPVMDAAKESGVPYAKLTYAVKVVSEELIKMGEKPLKIRRLTHRERARRMMRAYQNRNRGYW